MSALKIDAIKPETLIIGGVVIIGLFALSRMLKSGGDVVNNVINTVEDGLVYANPLNEDGLIGDVWKSLSPNYTKPSSFAEALQTTFETPTKNMPLTTRATPVGATLTLGEYLFHKGEGWGEDIVRSVQSWFN